MNSPLDELRDIALPESVSWWPPAPGYCALLAFIIIFVAFITWLYFHWKTHLRYISAAKNEFSLLLEETDNDEALILNSARLIKRYMQSRNKSNSINFAQLNGEQWKQQLTPYMSEETARLITIDQYKRLPEINREAFTEDIMAFLKGYKS